MFYCSLGFYCKVNKKRLQKYLNKCREYKNIYLCLMTFDSNFRYSEICSKIRENRGSTSKPGQRNLKLFMLIINIRSLPFIWLSYVLGMNDSAHIWSSWAWNSSKCTTLQKWPQVKKTSKLRHKIKVKLKTQVLFTKLTMSQVQLTCSRIPNILVFFSHC